MTSQEYFNAVRAYVNAHGNEPREGFQNNNLSVTVGEYCYSIQGRNRGKGYVTVERADNFDQIACELPARQGGYFDAKAAAETLLPLVMASAPKAETTSNGEPSPKLSDNEVLAVAKTMVANGNTGRVNTLLREYQQSTNILEVAAAEGRTVHSKHENFRKSALVNMRREIVAARLKQAEVSFE